MTGFFPEGWKIEHNGSEELIITRLDGKTFLIEEQWSPGGYAGLNFYLGDQEGFYQKKVDL